MVVVIADPALEPGRMSGGLNPPQQARRNARSQHVVDGLRGHRTELLPHARPDGVRSGVRMLGEPGQHDNPRHRDPQPGRTQRPRRCAVRIDGRKSHSANMLPLFLE
jgi:hypothetical protein